MSLKLSSHIASMINLITLIGVVLIAGSISALAIAVSWDHSLLLPYLSSVLTMVILGIIIIWIASKLSEVLE